MSPVSLFCSYISSFFFSFIVLYDLTSLLFFHCFYVAFYHPFHIIVSYLLIIVVFSFIFVFKSTPILPLLWPELLSYKYPSASFCSPKYLCSSPHSLHILPEAPLPLCHTSFTCLLLIQAALIPLLTSTNLPYFYLPLISTVFTFFSTSDSLSHIHPFYSLVFNQQPSLIPLSTFSSTPYIVHLLLLPSQPESGV